MCVCCRWQFGGVDSRWSRWTLGASYIPTVAYTQAGAVPACPSVPVEGHVEDTRQRSDVLSFACSLHFYIQVSPLLLLLYTP